MSEQASIDQRLVLVVEDNADDVLLLQRAFQKAELVNPIQVLTDGQQAVEYLTGEGKYSDRDLYPLPAVILVDLKLPKLSGFELLGRLREYPHLKRIPTVVLTSSREYRDVREAYELGANSYIVKSDRVIEMVKAIQLYWLKLNELPAT